MSKARTVANMSITPAAVSDQTNTSTGYFDAPAGTTAQRPASPINGMIRYNSDTGYLENYTATGWASIASPPVVSSTNVNNVDESATTQTIIITGSNFDSSAIALLVAPGGAVKTPTTSTRNSANQITITYSGTDLLTAAVPEPLDVKVTNGSGLSSVLAGAIYIDATPIWSSPASGNIATIIEGVAMSPVSLVATDSEGSTVSFSLTSGALPSGLTLSGSTISGTSSAGGSYSSAGTTFNFTVGASDGTGNTTPRAFNILRKWLDGSSSSAAAVSADAIKTLTGTTTSGMFWLKPSGWTYPALCYCEMSLHGGGWIYILQRQCQGTGTSNSSLPGSWLTAQAATPNHASSNFYGVADSSGAGKSPQDMWNAFIGSGSNGKWFVREIQTANGSYDESQRYVGSSDNPIFSWTNFARHFSGNYSNGSWVSGIRVYYNNGSNYVDGKLSTTWSAPSLATINNGNTDQDLWFCNGTDSYDANWGFGLMKGGSPFPKSADATNGGARGSSNITRWGIVAIKA